MHPYERWTIRGYLANALKSNRFKRPPRADTTSSPGSTATGTSLGLPELTPRAHASSSMGGYRSADAGGALEGVARRGDRHGPRARAKSFASSKAPRLACARLFAHPG